MPNASPLLLTIIAISSLCAQGFLRPFEKEKPFCYRRDWRGRTRVRKKERDLTWSERNMLESARLCFCICACMDMFIYPSERLFVSWSLSPSGTAVQRGHQLAVGFVIWEGRSRSPTVHCLLNIKISCGNQVKFTNWPQFVCFFYLKIIFV